jgi:hypothetical protein
MIGVLLWMRFVFLLACGAVVSLYVWIGYRSDRLP